MTPSVGAPAIPAPAARPATTGTDPESSDQFAGLLRDQVADLGPADRPGQGLDRADTDAAHESDPVEEGTVPAPPVSLVPAWLTLALQAGGRPPGGDAVAAPGTPVAGAALAGVPIAGAPVAGVPVAGVAVPGIPVAGIPIAGVPVAGVAGATAVEAVPTGTQALPTVVGPAPAAAGTGATVSSAIDDGATAVTPPAAGTSTVASTAAPADPPATTGHPTALGAAVTAALAAAGAATPLPADGVSPVDAAQPSAPVVDGAGTPHPAGRSTTGTGTGQQSSGRSDPGTPLAAIDPDAPAATSAVPAGPAPQTPAPQTLAPRTPVTAAQGAHPVLSPTDLTAAAPTAATLDVRETAPTAIDPTTPTEGTVDGTGLPATAGTAPSTPGSAAPAPAAVLAPAPPVAAQLVHQLTALAAGPDGSHAVTVVLAPESLGEVHVQLVVTGDQVSLTLAAGAEHGRAALAEALPDLRRDLAAAGLTVTSAEVSSDVPGQSSGSAGAQQMSQGWAQGWGQRTAPGDRWAGTVPTGSGTADEDDDTTSTTRHTSTGATSTGVDIRV